MADLPLDTSGEVKVLLSNTGGEKQYGLYGWRHLTRFERGYLKAMFAAFNAEYFPVDGGKGLHRFSDIDPDTLMTIKKDCAEYEKFLGPWTEDEREAMGRQFWLRHPKSTFLTDDGKVCLRVVA